MDARAVGLEIFTDVVIGDVLFRFAEDLFDALDGFVRSRRQTVDELLLPLNTAFFAIGGDEAEKLQRKLAN